MRNLILRVFIIALLTSWSHLASGQGCSDAGFCTLNSFKPNNIDSIYQEKNQFKIGLSYGKADNSISIFGTYLEYSRQINERLGIGAKVTALSQSGNGISVFGLSDIYVNMDYQMSKKAKLTLGTKLPLTNGNKMQGQLSLPMDYQSSLGTIDLILGIGYQIDKFQLVTALQQPITQNGNGFISTLYPINSKLRSFQSTNKFKRSGDVLLRVSYPIKLGDKIKFTPGLLPIYHLINDKFTDLSGLEKEINGSRGLTLNGNVYFDYELNKMNFLQLNLGFPFVVRKARPDGLTRSFIMNIEYKIRF